MNQEVPLKVFENGPLGDRAALPIHRILRIYHNDKNALEYKNAPIPTRMTR
jgi:hypothetical protein